MAKYKKIAVLMGGPSAEREVSLVSGRECASGLRDAGYEVVEIDAGDDLPERLRATAPDAVFNALHGRWGEDGCVQGILEWMKIPYTHSGVMASAVAMDKERAKAVYLSEGLPIAESILATPAAISADHVMALPYVVKPYNEGSSVGIHIATEGANTPPQVNTPDAPERLMVERYVPGRELTVSVMDGEAMAVTEIIAEGWYDYAAKYEAGGSRHEVPANLPEDITAQCLDYATRAHSALGCRGVSRSDFRYDPVKGEVIILETNTQPGMTPTSLTPEQAAHKGTSFSELVAWMVEDASCGR